MRRFCGTVYGESSERRVGRGTGSAPLFVRRWRAVPIALVVGLGYSQALRVVDPSSFRWMTEHGSVLSVDGPYFDKGEDDGSPHVARLVGALLPPAS